MGARRDAESTVQEEVAAFVHEILPPHPATRERRADPELFAKLSKGKLLGLALPKQHGGRDWSVSHCFNALEALGDAGMDMGACMAFATHSVLCGGVIAACCNDAQRSHYLQDLAQGSKVFGLSVHDLLAGAGPAPDALEAKPWERQWVLNGTKACVINGAEARFAIVTALTHPGRAPRSHTAFLVDLESDGVTVGKRKALPLLPACATADLVFANCKIRSEAVIGDAHKAYLQAVPVLMALERSLCLAPWVGLLNRTLRESIQHLRNSAWLGEPRSKFAAHRRRLFEIRRVLEQARDLSLLASQAVYGMRKLDGLTGAMAKLFLAENLPAALGDALTLYGFEPPEWLERAYQDALFLSACGGGPEVLHSVIAGAMLQRG